MTTTVEHRSVIRQDVPSGLLTLQLPPGVSLDKWVEMENTRLKHQFPAIKEPYAELGAEASEILNICKAERALWAMRYEVHKLRLREDLGFAQRGLANGVPFIERRMFPVKGYEVDPYEQDALYPL
jgi:hypothetical protein